jgi:hypothetical protein
MGVAKGVPTDFYLAPGQDFDLLKWATYVLNTEGPLRWRSSKQPPTAP